MDIHFEIHNSFNISGQKEITDIILRIWKRSDFYGSSTNLLLKSF